MISNDQIRNVLKNLVHVSFYNFIRTSDIQIWYINLIIFYSRFKYFRAISCKNVLILLAVAQMKRKTWDLRSNYEYIY